MPEFHGCMSGWQWGYLSEKMLRAGLNPEQCDFKLLSGFPEEIDHDRLKKDYSLLVGLGESPLRRFTGKSAIDKWHLSPLLTAAGQKFIPTFDLGRLQKQYELGMYMELAFRRVATEAQSSTYERAPERFFLNPPAEEAIAILDKVIREEHEVSCDVETGRGQINTVGFAWSPSDAIAINVLPDRLGDDTFYRLWQKIAELLESKRIGKIFQNYIYDTSYFSAYGIRTENITHDTMHAMKVLYPELDQNLGNVGRLFTNRPYWKDDGKVEGEEGKKKDWGFVRDWTKHYLYNCRDCTGTFEAKGNQQLELHERGLNSFFYDYIMRLPDPIREMCAVGVPVSAEVRDRLRLDLTEQVEWLTKKFHAEVGSELNPNSPAQVMKFLKENKVALPKKYDKKTGSYKESSDASSLKKVRLKRPDLISLGTLAEIKTLKKALSSYINFDMRPDGRLSYSLNITGTETLRFSGGKDAWGRGFNIQTIPTEGSDISIKQQFVAPEGWSICEVDLRQAESRFVAYDSADATLIEMLESGADVHTHVGKAILKQMNRDPEAIPKDEFKLTWRQLGKKAGHGLNYFMKPRMFVETVFVELDMVISVKDAELITSAYYGLFPGIPNWHRWIRNELYTKRRLSAPSGWERYFYGRMGDDLFKEGYAWRPQHTIPWITNHLMLHLCDVRKHESLKFQFLVQVHDALYMLAPNDEIEQLAKVCLATENWHPEIILPGGKMIIPVEIKSGQAMNKMSEWEGQ